MELKYILDSYGNFALFSPVNAHNDMARGFYQKPVSAGFCRLHTKRTLNEESSIEVHCYGESMSLHLASRPEDDDIITRKLNNPYE